MVRDTVLTSLASIVCFQETKLDVIDTTLVMETLSPAFDGFCYLSATQSRGGGHSFGLDLKQGRRLRNQHKVAFHYRQN